MDVEELCYFVEVLMLLPIFDDLEGGEHIKSCESCREPVLQDCHSQWQELLGSSLKHQTETATTQQHVLHPNSHGSLNVPSPAYRNSRKTTLLSLFLGFSLQPGRTSVLKRHSALQR